MRLVALVCLVLAACASTGQTLAYRKAVTARDKAVTVLAHVSEPYGRHIDEMNDLVLDVDAAYTQAQSHSDNRATKQWLQVKDEVHKLAADWQQLEVLGGPYLEQRKKIIMGYLDAIVSDAATKQGE